MRGLWSLSLLAAVSLALPVFAADNSGEVQLTREGKASIQMALQYLANQQHSDGSMSGGGGGTSGIVATACLAWMCSGSLPGEGPYGKNVAKGIDYLLSCAQPSGFIFKGREGGSMYHHGLATICLAEAWGQTRDKRIAEKLKKAIDLIIRCQNGKGGWRYEPRLYDQDDLSVVVMQLLALRAAKDAGVSIPKDVIENAVKYVEKCRNVNDPDGPIGFSYQPGGGKTFSTTAAGVMSLMLCGNYKAAALKDSLNYLIRAHEKKEDRTWFLYGHYYASQVMYQAGGQGEKYLAFWQKWYPDISKTIMQRQITTGPERGRYFYNGEFQNSEHGAWTTAMSALILGIPYRYLPIYQR